jgi:hypothetical protein
MVAVLSEQLVLDAVVALLLLLLRGPLSCPIGLGSKGASTLIRRLIVGSCKLVSDDDDDNDDEVSSTMLTP